MESIPIRNIKTPSSELGFSGSFSIRNVRNVLGGKRMVKELHRHNFFFILAVKKGSGSHHVDFKAHDICDNSIAFVRPGQVHQLSLNTGSAGYLIQFKNDFYYSHDKIPHQLLSNTSIKSICLFDAVTFKKLFSILHYIFQEYTDKNEGYQEVIKASMEIFLIELGRCRGDKNNQSDHENHYMQNRLEQFMDLLEKHISHHKEVSHYADRMQLSQYQLNAITKATQGKTCSEVINEYIILESKRYLLATYNQVKDVAYHLGYEDVSYFIRFFKKHTGYSPEAFRRNFR